LNLYSPKEVEVIRRKREKSASAPKRETGMKTQRKDAGLQLLALMVNRQLGPDLGGLAREISVDDLSLHVTMRNNMPVAHVELDMPLGKTLRATCRASYVASASGLDGLVRTAKAFAGTVWTISGRTGELGDMVKEVAKEARSCAAKARRATLEVRVAHVGLGMIDSESNGLLEAAVHLDLPGNDALNTRHHIFRATFAEEVRNEFERIARWQSPLAAS